MRKPIALAVFIAAFAVMPLLADDPFVLKDPFLGRAIRMLRGLRPIRTATVAQALLHARRGATLVRLCAWELERLKEQPTETAAARLERERGLGPWSIGVVCLEGLGRFERGLQGDLGLVKLLGAMRGRRVEGWETAELLEPYGEWAGLASVYMLAGWHRGYLPVAAAA
jgi:3-methyladenine DNA glycosylase/8-oxoguanine DNA glycosylase